jgi:hypothetical protein
MAYDNPAMEPKTPRLSKRLLSQAKKISKARGQE